MGTVTLQSLKKHALALVVSSAMVSAVAFQAMPAEVHAAELPVLTNLIKQNRDAVVHIQVEVDRSEKTAMGKGFQMPEGQAIPEQFREFFRNMPQMPQQRRAEAMGSGFIISQDGYIVTNAHVVDNADKVKVVLNDKRELAAEIVGQDSYSDIALLKVDAKDLPTVSLGSSDNLEVGQWVFAIGAPFGLDHTATQGIVSALSRSLPDGTYVPFIQTDVAVNPGNSGGPLFDLNGNVVGVNSQIYSRSGGYMGISFAIPVDLVKSVTEQLKTSGSVSRGWLGVHIQNLDQELANSFGMNSPKGALVANVQPSSPADQAGVQAGDIIVGFDRSSVDSADHLPLLVGTTAIGKEVPMKVLRNGEEKSLNVKIAKLEGDKTTEPAMSKVSSGQLGLMVAPMSDEERKQAELNSTGVMVKEVQSGSPAEKAGLQSGDIVLTLNNRPVTDPAALKDAVKQAAKDKPLAMLVLRDGRRQFVAVRPE